MNSVSSQIEQKISKLKKGTLIFVSDFNLDYEITRKTLQRLTTKKMLLRISQGIYYKPLTDEKLGIIYPSIEQLAEAIAKRDKARIIPTGSYAMYKLGLTTQIPMNVVYLTDGSARKIQIKRQKINFKKTSPRNLAVKHQLTGLIIQSLKEIGEKNITSKELNILKKIITKNGEHKKIQDNIKYAPVWIQKIVIELIKT